MWTALQEPCDENVIRAQPPGTSCSKSRRRWVLVATILASSMAFIDGTVVNVALPALQLNLDATALDVQWVVEAYSLLLSALLLVGGSLGDHYGRRRVFLIGVGIFALASAACGFAESPRQLIGARAFQGLGAALLIPGSLAIISSAFPAEERGRAIGTWSGFSAITAAIGPVTGGWLIEHVSWRAVFFINVPIALAVIVIALRRVPESSDRDSARIDWLGAFLASTALGTLVYGLIESSRLGLTSRPVIAILSLSIALILLFLFTEARLSHPMLPLVLFRSRVFAGTNLLTFLLYAALGGTLFFLPLNLIQVQHYSAAAAGASLLPFVIIISLLSRWSGGLVAKYGSRIPLTLGPLIAALGFLLLARAGIGRSYWSSFFPATVLLGLGMAVSVAPLTTTVMNAIAPNRIGVASGINNAIARTAGLVAIAVLGIVMLHRFRASLAPLLVAAHVPASAVDSINAQTIKLAAIDIPPTLDPATRQIVRQTIDQSFVSGFEAVMITGAILAAAGAVVSLLFIAAPAPRRVGEKIAT